MLNILDVVNEENNKIKNQGKIEEKEQKIAKKDGKKLQRKMNFLAELRYHKAEAAKRKADRKFQADCKKSFDDFLNLSHNSSELRGIETFKTINGPSKIIFTDNLGPFSKIQLPEDTNANELSCFLYEGFAKNPNGFYEYYNLAVKKILRPTGSTFTQLSGFSVEPGTNIITVINEQCSGDLTFIEKHFNELEQKYSAIEVIRSE